MSAKLIIWCRGNPAVNGMKRRSFLWNPGHKCYVHDNREFDEREFNEVVEGVFKKNQDLHPCVRVVGFSDKPEAKPAPQEPADLPPAASKTEPPKPAVPKVPVKERRKLEMMEV
jgi:hypothetical protein